MANLHIVAACELNSVSGEKRAPRIEMRAYRPLFVLYRESGWIIVPCGVLECPCLHVTGTYWREHWCTRARLSLKRIPVSGRIELDLWGPSLAGRRDRWSPGSFT